MIIYKLNVQDKKENASLPTMRPCRSNESNKIVVVNSQEFWFVETYSTSKRKLSINMNEDEMCSTVDGTILSLINSKFSRITLFKIEELLYQKQC